MDTELHIGFKDGTSKSWIVYGNYEIENYPQDGSFTITWSIPQAGVNNRISGLGESRRRHGDKDSLSVRGEAIAYVHWVGIKGEEV